MTYNGRIKGGNVVLDDSVQLPEGAVVAVSVVELNGAQSASEMPRTLLDRLAALDGAAEGLPSDLARNHDHYLHGLPKR
jgi:hypothetical protein